MMTHQRACLKQCLDSPSLTLLNSSSALCNRMTVTALHCDGAPCIALPMEVTTNRFCSCAINWQEPSLATRPWSCSVDPQIHDMHVIGTCQSISTCCIGSTSFICYLPSYTCCSIDSSWRCQDLMIVKPRRLTVVWVKNRDCVSSLLQ